MKDCRDCVEWETCPCGKPGHEKGTHFGYSIGECKDYVERDQDEEIASDTVDLIQIWRAQEEAQNGSD